MGEHTVRIYTNPTCPYCKQTKKYLDENGIQYTNIDVTADSKARQEMIDKSDQMGVPVLDIDSKIIVGFDKPLIDQALGL